MLKPKDIGYLLFFIGFMASFDLYAKPLTQDQERTIKFISDNCSNRDTVSKMCLKLAKQLTCAENPGQAFCVSPEHLDKDTALRILDQQLGSSDSVTGTTLNHENAVPSHVSQQVQSPIGATRGPFEGADPRATLRAGEVYSRTANGCGLILGPYPSLSESNRKQYEQFHLEDTWQGACVNGLALGPGKLIDRDYKGKVDFIRERWFLYGRPIGEGHIVNALVGGTATTFVWNGVEYVIQGDMESPSAGAGGSKVLVYAQRRLRWRYEISEYCGGEMCVVVEDMDLPSGTGRVKYPCGGSCRSVWKKRVGPVLKEYQSFRKHYEPEVEAAKLEAAPVLAALQAGQDATDLGQGGVEIADALQRSDQNLKDRQARISELNAQRKEARRSESADKILGALGTVATGIAAYQKAKAGSAGKGDSRMGNPGDLTAEGLGNSSELDEKIKKSALSEKPCLREVNLSNESEPNADARLEYPQGVPFPKQYLHGELRVFDGKTMRYVKNPKGVENVRKAFFSEFNGGMMKRRIDEHWFDDVAMRRCLSNKNTSVQKCQRSISLYQLAQCQDYFTYFFITGKIQKLPRIWSQAIHSDSELMEVEGLRDEVLNGH